MGARSGFHRLGIVIAAPLIVAALAVGGWSAFKFATLPDGGPWYDGNAALDFPRIQRNVKKMIDQNAPMADVVGYLNSESISTADIQSLSTEQLLKVRENAIAAANRRTEIADARQLSAVAGIIAVIGIVLYLASRAIGWVISGFRH